MVSQAPKKPVVTAKKVDVKPAAVTTTPVSNSIVNSTPIVKPAAVKSSTPAKTTVKPAAKPAPKLATKTITKPVAKPAAVKKTAKKDDKKTKPEKVKMERDSFTMPKDEYAQLILLKARMIKLGHPVKKSELLRAGVKLLAAMSDNTLKATMEKIPAIKTGRPKK